MYKLVISRAENGFIVKEITKGEEPNIKVFQTDDDAIHSFASLLYSIKEWAGFSGSRYDEKRIYIDVRPGDKHPSAESPPPDEL